MHKASITETLAFLIVVVLFMASFTWGCATGFFSRGETGTQSEAARLGQILEQRQREIEQDEAELQRQRQELERVRVRRGHY